MQEHIRVDLAVLSHFRKANFNVTENGRVHPKEFLHTQDTCIIYEYHSLSFEDGDMLTKVLIEMRPLSTDGAILILVLSKTNLTYSVYISVCHVQCKGVCTSVGTCTDTVSGGTPNCNEGYGNKEISTGVHHCVCK